MAVGGWNCHLITGQSVRHALRSAPGEPRSHHTPVVGEDDRANEMERKAPVILPPSSPRQECRGSLRSANFMEVFTKHLRAHAPGFRRNRCNQTPVTHISPSSPATAAARCRFPLVRCCLALALGALPSAAPAAILHGPVGSFTPNGYGPCDMSGNMREWCWDRYSIGYYASSPGTDPRGPSSGEIHQLARNADCPI